MIIKCVNCNKKFEVDASLIPENGRTIQCGSCNHIWFYSSSKIIATKITDETFNDKHDQEIQKTNLNEKLTNINDDDLSSKKSISTPIKDSKKKETIDHVTRSSKLSSNFSLSKILSYFLVTIVSFVALIIFLDTFKSLLSDIFPTLELVLYNLFESIKDVSLFVKDLLV